MTLLRTLRRRPLHSYTPEEVARAHENGTDWGVVALVAYLVGYFLRDIQI
jgi:hypothetical protein